MKNISLHAPLNNTNRNWERTLIKKANSGGSSLEKGAYAFTVYSIPDEMLAQMPEPELIPTDTPEYSVYHVLKVSGTDNDPAQAGGLIVLHNYNNLTLLVTTVENLSSTNKQVVTVNAYDGTKPFNPRNVKVILGDWPYTQSSQGWGYERNEGDVVPYTYIQDSDFTDTLDIAVRDFLEYEYPTLS